MKFFIILIFIFSSIPANANRFSVQTYKGKALVNGEKLTKSFPLQIGDSLEIRGENSYIIIKNMNNSTFMIKDGKIKLLKFDRQEFIIQLETGKFFLALHKLQKEQKLKVQTSNSLFSIENAHTKLMIYARNNYDYLCVGDGNVFAKKISEMEEFNVGAEEDIFVYYSDKKKSKKAANLKMYKRMSEGFSLIKFPIENRLLK